MNKLVVAVGAVVLLAGGYYFGQANRPEPTIIKVPEAPKAEFSSEGAAEVAAIRHCLQRGAPLWQRA